MHKTISIIIMLLSCWSVQTLHYHRMHRRTSDATTVKLDYRLPTFARPKHYAILLNLYLDERTDKDYTFDGSVEIELEVEHATPRITFHAENLRFARDDCAIEKVHGQRIENFSLKFENRTSLVHIVRRRGYFSKGLYVLKINYSSDITNDPNALGVYRTSYVNANNDTVWQATTQFEPIYARRMIPCFDEPTYKAHFDITIVHSKHYNALSNMPVKSVVHDESRTTTTFETTPLMSTYLLAFLVSDFVSISNAHKNISVFAPRDLVQYGAVALKTGEQVMGEFERFTGVKYELKKIDHISLPATFTAMENWGLIVYSQEQFLFNDKVNSTNDKQTTKMLVAHELAHQWFGNIVSPKWWTYLWLNEGPATYFSYLVLDKIEPSLRTVDQFVVTELQIAFTDDSLPTSHPLSTYSESPDEIENMFDSITYCKGAAVIRMLQHLITKPVFQKGIQIYLNQTLHKIAEPEDLFNAMQKAVDDNGMNFPVKTVMYPWTSHKGYPIVTVARNYSDDTFSLKQERFYSYKVERKSDYGSNYYVPVNYATPKKLDFNITTPDSWLFNSSMQFHFYVQSEDWLILNKQQTYFYRVNYDKRNWRLLIDYLSSSEFANIHVLNRAQLMSDALVFVQQGILSVKTLVRLTNYLKQETDYIAWYPGFKTLQWLSEKLINTEHYPVFSEYALKIVKQLVNRIGYEEREEDEHLTKLNRVTAIDWACFFGDADCVNAMHEKLLKWLDDSQKNPISTDLKQVVLCNGLRVANHSTWVKVLKKRTLDRVGTEKDTIYTKALGCSTNREILKKYLNFFMDPILNFEYKVKDIVLSVYEGTGVGIDVALDFLIDLLSDDYLQSNDDTMYKIIKIISKKITTTTQLNKLKTLKYVNILSNKINDTIAQAEQNIKWIKKNGDLIINTIKDINI